MFIVDDDDDDNDDDDDDDDDAKLGILEMGTSEEKNFLSALQNKLLDLLHTFCCCRCS
jgi:hypothetical protein